ncbi:transport and Golgi organization protein 2 homolog [Antedon mediterranea]|uniref:transport and Golgi organization protein 2 homolog n=1 Tax=Antedon mediterranea TaxID=105859 RepID=UPI003AF44F7A
MCVTWFMVNENSGVIGYKLVLAFNRDEFFDRPALPAEFLESNGDVLCGVDMTPGKEGGTWLGISKMGKVACLLNIRDKHVNPELKGRGSLVTNFLTSDIDGYSYLKQLTGTDYNGFNLLTMDFRNYKPEICYYSNRSESEPVTLETGYYGVSNSLLFQPWPKANAGKEYLEQLLKDKPTISAEELTKHLISYAQGNDGLATKVNFFLNEEELSKALPKTAFVDSPIYGTRCTTVILIDNDGKVTYTEKTRIDPMDSENTNWSSKTTVFNIKSSLDSKY